MLTGICGTGIFPKSIEFRVNQKGSQVLPVSFEGQTFKARPEGCRGVRERVCTSIVTVRCESGLFLWCFTSGL